MAKIYKFKDDEIEGTVNIVISSITSFGIKVTQINDTTGLPTLSVIWIDVGNMSFSREVSHEKALRIEEDIIHAIHGN